MQGAGQLPEIHGHSGAKQIRSIFLLDLLCTNCCVIVTSSIVQLTVCEAANVLPRKGFGGLTRTYPYRVSATSRENSAGFCIAKAAKIDSFLKHRLDHLLQNNINLAPRRAVEQMLNSANENNG